MPSIKVLDCTLRDGGYCNQWEFGFLNTKKIINYLLEANIDIIECGFLTNRVVYNPQVTKFTTLEELSEVIPKNRKDKLFVAMMNYGEYDVSSLPEYDGTSVNGIRVAFHKRDLDQAIAVCNRIKEKGYKVFVQAMVSLCYTDAEFLELIQKVNSVNPYAFYIVDSFGMMKEKELNRLFYLVENNLNEGIQIGFHSHNNLQLAYSNAQKLVGIHTKFDLIIDSSVYGMGRGAGNLNTELFVQYLNENAGGRYDIKPLLLIIDEVLENFYQMNYWGYSLPNYLSASHNAHPSYAGYLSDKKTLTVEAMNGIFSMMEEEKKYSFDKAYIEKLYFRYMEKGEIQEAHKAELKERLAGKKVLLIAPGKSSSEEHEKIKRFAEQSDVVSISVNHAYKEMDTDLIFASNLRRFRDLDDQQKIRCIITSNITADGVYLQTKYCDLLNAEEYVSDNAGLMAVKFLIEQNVSEIYLAGFDGYSHNVEENYGDRHMTLAVKTQVLDEMNRGITKILSSYAKNIRIRFLTKPRHIVL